MYKYSYLLHGVAVLCLIANSALGQVAQDKPELCGGGDRSVPLPADIAATPGDSGIFSTLLVTAAGSSVPAHIQVEMGSVEEVCPISPDKLLVFGNSNPATSIAIIDRNAAKLLDSFSAYDPVISPNQHWLVLRDFYPPQSELPASEEYLLYDLTKDKAANHLPGIDPYVEASGRVIYPLVPDGRPFMHAGLPKNQTHSFSSRSFFWSSDSQAIIFVDQYRDSLWAVLVNVNGSEVHTFVHRINAPEPCEQGSQGDISAATLTLAKASFGAGQNGNRTIELQFQSSDYGACRPKELILYPSDFVEATPETHAPIHYEKQSVLKQ